MLWPPGDRVDRELRLPPDLHMRVMERRDIPTVVAILDVAFPDLATAEDHSALSAAFYEEQVAFAGEDRSTEECPLFVLLIESASGALACALMEYEPIQRALLLRLIAVVPAARGWGLGRALLEAHVAVGQAVGAIELYGLTAVDNRAQCALFARLGYALCGIIPDSDRREVAPGELRFIPEALYRKGLVPAQTARPEPAALRPGTAALMHLLFVHTEAAAAPSHEHRLSACMRASPPIPATADDPWPDVVSRAPDSPAGATLRPLAGTDVPRLLSHISLWDPELAASSYRYLLTHTFYKERVALADEDATIGRRPYRTVVLEIEGDLAGAAWISLNVPRSTLRLELAVVDPRRRRQGLTRSLAAEFVALGHALGVETLLSAVTLRHPSGQRVLEFAGLTPVGILPAAQYHAVTPDVYHEEYLALYALSLVPQSLRFLPARATMLPAVAALAELVFGPGDGLSVAR